MTGIHTGLPVEDMTGSGKSGAESSHQYRERFNTTISDTLMQAIRLVRSDPSIIIPGMVIIRHQKRAARIRGMHEQQGLLVPPVIIISITARCNLRCTGCYMQGRGDHKKPEMDPDVLSSIIREAALLGVSVIVIAGGEPLIRSDEIIHIAQEYPHILFPVFSNGLLIDETMAGALALCKNIVPLISFEGFREDTDARRGEGVFNRLLETYTLLSSHNIFFGCSITITRDNLEEVLSESFIRTMIERKVRVFSYVEYVPMTPGTEDCILTPALKKLFISRLMEMNREYPALFIGFPGEEDYYGGCLAAGRGFVHISPSADLEPCPAAPFSDVNLRDKSLKEALQSHLLYRLRQVPEILSESEGGCALHANRKMVEDILGSEDGSSGPKAR